MWINSMIAWLLKSPLHPLMSKGLILVTVAGRKSGKPISAPVAYLREGNTLWVVSRRKGKWWRNLRGGADVRVVLLGENLAGRGSVIEEEQAVAKRLFENFQTDKRGARFAQVSLDETGQPVFADCERAAQTMLVIRIDLL